MSIAVVAIDSGDEDITAVCREYRETALYPALVDGGAQITPVAGSDDSRPNVAEALRQQQGGYITGSGHGFPDQFTGAQQQPVVRVGQYAAVEVTGKIVHLLACECAAQLGPDLVSNGCKAFFGYDEVFTFPFANPTPFLECDSAIDLALTNGGTAGDAYDAAITAFNERIARLKRAGDVHHAAMLERNRDHLCAPSVDPKYGAEDAVLLS